MSNSTSNTAHAQPIASSTTSINLFTLARMLSATSDAAALRTAAPSPEPERNVLAIARVGGMGGPVWSYAAEPAPVPAGARVGQYEEGEAGGGGPRWWV